jgi:hypothetical protein
MLSVANKPIMLNVVMLNVVMLECRYAECRGAMASYCYREGENDKNLKSSNEEILHLATQR